MKKKSLLLVFGSCLVFGAISLVHPILNAQTAAPAPANPAAPARSANAAAANATAAETAAVTAVIAQLQQQQTQMAANQTAIEQKMAELAENVRQARIFARRGGGGGGE